jgi:hypothetical protein
MEGVYTWDVNMYSHRNWIGLWNLNGYMLAYVQNGLSMK